MIKLFDSNMNEVTIKREMYQWDIFPLDNFSAFGFVMNSEYFQTSEHAFQYLKFVDTNKEIANKIKESFSPNDARNIAHENKTNINWLITIYLTPLRNLLFTRFCEN